MSRNATRAAQRCAGDELSFAADVPHARAERDDDAESREQQRHGLEERALQCERASDRPGERIALARRVAERDRRARRMMVTSRRRRRPGCLHATPAIRFARATTPLPASFGRRVFRDRLPARAGECERLVGSMMSRMAAPYARRGRSCTRRVASRSSPRVGSAAMMISDEGRARARTTFVGCRRRDRPRVAGQWRGSSEADHLRRVADPAQCEVSAIVI
jgi:hypothetical protein